MTKKKSLINESAKQRMMEFAGFSKEKILETLSEGAWGQSGQMGQSTSSKDPNASIGKNWGNRGKEELTEVDEPEEDENPFAADDSAADDSEESETPEAPEGDSEPVEAPEVEVDSEPSDGGMGDIPKDVAEKVMTLVSKALADALGISVDIESDDAGMESEVPAEEPVGDDMGDMGPEPPMPGQEPDLMAGSRNCNSGCPDQNPGNRMGGSAVAGAPAGSAVPPGGLNQNYANRGCGNRGQEEFSEEMLQEVFKKVLKRIRTNK